MNFQLKQLITEPDSKPQDTTDSYENDSPRESIMNSCGRLPTTIFRTKTQTTLSQANNVPENHHTTTIPCNNQKQLF